MIGTTAALIAGGLGLAGSVTSGILANKAAGTQADAALTASTEANALQKYIYDQNRQDLSPWTGAGGAAVTRLAQLLGLHPNILSNGTFSSGSTTTTGTGGGPLANQAATGGTQYTPSRTQATIGMDGGYAGQFARDNVMPGDAIAPGATGPLNPALMQDGTDTAMNGVPSGGAATNLLGSTLGGTSTADATGGGTDPADFGSLMHDFTNADFVKDPGYDFRMAEGQKAIERSASARGGLFSGATLKSLGRYGQDYASNEFNNAYNRYQSNRTSKYNMLAGLAGLGQTSANTVANSGENFANVSGANTVAGITGAGNARASGYVATGNAINSGLNGALGVYLGTQFGKTSNPYSGLQTGITG